MKNDDLDMVEITPEQKKAQRARNIAIGIVLAGFVVLLYTATWAKLGANLFNRPL